jgi:hypothetical protein
MLNYLPLFCWLLIATKMILVSSAASTNSKKNETFKPFEYLQNHPLSLFNSDELMQFEPKIFVQSVLSEGMGWRDGLSKSNAFHVVVSLLGKNPENKKQTFPLAGQFITIKSEKSLPCLIERGKGDFEACDLSPEFPRSFTTNAMGRISFSIPIKGIEQLEEHFPPLFLRIDAIQPEEW